MHGLYAHYMFVSYAEGFAWLVYLLLYSSYASHIEFTSPFNATVVEMLQGAGAEIIGKTNCDEFGMG